MQQSTWKRIDAAEVRAATASSRVCASVASVSSLFVALICSASVAAAQVRRVVTHDESNRVLEVTETAALHPIWTLPPCMLPNCVAWISSVGCTEAAWFAGVKQSSDSGVDSWIYRNGTAIIHLPGADVNDVHVTIDGDVLYSSYDQGVGKISRWDGVQSVVLQSSSALYFDEVTQGPNGTYYAVVHDGMSIERVVKYPQGMTVFQPSEGIAAIAATNSGNLYVATDHQIWIVDGSNRKTKVMYQLVGDSGFGGVAADAYGNWYATMDNGDDGGSRLIHNGQVMATWSSGLDDIDASQRLLLPSCPGAKPPCDPLVPALHKDARRPVARIYPLIAPVHLGSKLVDVPVGSGWLVARDEASSYLVTTHHGGAGLKWVAEFGLENMDCAPGASPSTGAIFPLYPLTCGGALCADANLDYRILQLERRASAQFGLARVDDALPASTPSSVPSCFSWAHGGGGALSYVIGGTNITTHAGGPCPIAPGTTVVNLAASIAAGASGAPLYSAFGLGSEPCVVGWISCGASCQAGLAVPMSVAWGAMKSKLMQVSPGMTFAPCQGGLANGLTANLLSLSEFFGGAQHLSINATSTHAAQFFLLLGSSSGISPGITLDGVHVPLNLDAYFTASLTAPNSGLLPISSGLLSASGHGYGTFALPASGAGALAGITLHHAATVWSTSTAALTWASNPVPILIEP
jgi:hypothetical protein